MKKTIFLSNIIILILLFTGCELNDVFGPSKKEIELKQKELALKEQEIKFNQLLKQKNLDAKLALKKSEQEQIQKIKSKESDAKIANNKAALDTKKEIELAKIQSTLEKEKIQIQKQKIESLNREKDLKYSIEKQTNDLKFNLAQQENINTLSTQKYIIVLGTVIVIIFSFILYTYYNNRRKDKLRAYEDNLDKYFREKENQAKVEIASKILDTIASGKLDAEQENRLISSLSGDSKTSQNTLRHENHDNHTQKIEVIHDHKDMKSKQL